MPRTLLATVFAAVSIIAFVLAPARGHAQSREDFAYGVIVDSTDPRSMARAREAGFTHAKMITFWDRLEPSKGDFFWRKTDQNDFDNILRAARKEDMKLIVRVDNVPGWAGGSPANANLKAVESFYQALADHGKDIVVGYEILNEPNLPFEWGGDPSPEGYAEFLKAAYRGIKAADPDALVLGGGPSPGTGGEGGTVEDTEFIRRMYSAGAKGYMDALSVHPYGGNTEPERDPTTCIICFRRVEHYRNIMVEVGDGKTPMWATEYGWLMDSGTYLGQYEWMKVSEREQADYVVRSFQYAQKNWPWMHGMLLSNLDASTTPYHQGPEDGMPWFAILNGDYSPRDAFHAFKAMRGEQIAIIDAKRKAEREAQARSQAETAARQRAQQETQAARSAQSDTPSADAPPAESRLTAGSAGVLRVTGTGGDGLSLRITPSATALRVKTLAEGASVEALGPEQTAEGRVWRQIKDTSGATGWAAAQYLK
ncbi:MAG: cellulase family glycosylhydrolase [Chloroflexota bacterium]